MTSMMEQHSHIFREELKKEYINLFQQLYIATLYGNQVIMGSDLVNDN